MTIDRNIYMGPYVECRFRPATREVDVYGCTNPGCHQYKRYRHEWKQVNPKFCADCGSPIGVSKMTKDDRPPPYDVVDDELTPTHGDPPGGDTFSLIPNVHRKGEPRYWKDSHAELHVDLQWADRAADMRWMETAFAKELAQLRKVYDDVVVKWGLHQWFS